MTKDKALYAFFSNFGLPAYPDNAVLNENGEPDVILPYLTYTPVFDSWGGEPVSLTVNLWYHTESEAIPNAKAQEISERIGRSGCVVLCDKGYIRLLRGSPWCQSLRDEADSSIKRRYINITAQYYTEN